MKTLKSILFSIAILAVATVANAKNPGSDKPFTVDYVISTYVAGVTEGNLKDFTSVLANDVTFNTVRKGGIVSLDKDDVLANLKNSEGVKQECTTTVTKAKETADGITYEVDMKYDNHSRIDMVTMVQNAGDWRISDVTTSYK